MYSLQDIEVVDKEIAELIQKEVEGPLAAHLLRCAGKPEQVECVWEEGSLAFR